jgi:hypothetical protein
MNDKRDALMTSRDRTPLACDLLALNKVQRERRFVLAQLLQVGICKVTELADGWAFHVDHKSIIRDHLEEFAALERLCCPFLNIVVQSNAEGGGTALEIAGGDGAKQFVAAQFGIRDEPGSE